MSLAAQFQTDTPSLNRSQPTLAIVAYNRLAFGPRQADLAQFAALGSDDQARLQRLIDQQLEPGSINDDALNQRIAQAGFTTINKTRAELWHDHVLGNLADVSTSLPVIELQRLTLMRAVYSRRQLQEKMASFWHDHFSVHGEQQVARSMMIHYDRDIIRPHLFGNFRALLEAVATSTTMLFNLDNYTSSNAGPNENWARELFELHTLGAENYLGSGLRQADVDGYPEEPAGYVDDDVYEATRAFTGWSVDFDDEGNNDGAFLYRPDWHDRFQKTVLGNFMTADAPPLSDGQAVLDRLASHPGTARFICRKLCQFFISDTPPAELIQSAADIFHAQTEAPDQLKQVVGHILREAPWGNMWGQKVKRPFTAFASLFRLLDADISLATDNDYANQIMRYMRDAGHELFNWPAPDGYPDSADFWLNTTSIYKRWRFYNWLVTRSEETESGIDFLVDVEIPAGSISANHLVDYWINRLLGGPIPESERTPLVTFMAQGHAADFELPVQSDDRTYERLRSLVALTLMTPTNLLR